MTIEHAKMMHSIMTYLDFVDLTINEKSSEFDARELDDVKIKCTILAAKIATVIKRRGI